MPRVRNAKPVEPKKPVRRPAKKAAPAKAAGGKKPIAAAASKPRARRPSEKNLSMLERVHLAQRLVAIRSLPKPPSWPTLAKQEGIPQSTLRFVLSTYEKEVAKLGDSSGLPVLEETLALHERMIAQLSREAVSANNPSARVGAIRQLGETLDRRLALLTALGRMPRSFRAQDELAVLSKVVGRLIEIVERRNMPDLVEELLELVREMQPVIEGRAQLVEETG